MPKTIPVTDVQYDWFAARARRAKTMTAAITHVMTLVDKHEADLAKYHAWVTASAVKPEHKHWPPPFDPEK